MSETRVNWYDGQNVTENDMDTEQSAWTASVEDVVTLASGSGVVREYVSQRILFDTNSAPTSIQTLISTQSLDGEPIYPTDSSGNTVITQPSNTTQGIQLAIELTEASISGSAKVKVYIFGQIFGGGFRQEVFTFDSNSELVTRNYYTNIVAIMTQDFRGNQNTSIDGVASRDNGGRLRIIEALPMRVARDAIMVSQAVEPNRDYYNFKPASISKTLNTLLSEIAATENLDVNDLGINTTSTSTRTLSSTDTGVIVGEKFKATTNNIQKVTLLLSVQKNTSAPAGLEYDWSGEIVVGIRKLQTTTDCPVAAIPDSLIEFDPEPSPLAEISFDKDELEDIGISLTDTVQEVDFVFNQTLLSDPTTSPNITPGDYYILTIRRSGNISTGTIVLQEAANTDADPTDTDEMRMSVFSQNTWTDVSTSDLWFKIYTDAIRIVDGTAYEDGKKLVSPKVKKNATTGVEEPYIEGNYSFINTDINTNNYLLLQAGTTYSDAESHPITGNSVFSRVSDTPSLSVVSESTLTTLISGGNVPLVLGAIKDTNSKTNPTVTGTTIYPGLVRATTFTIINPPSDLLVYNVVGSILTPNTLEPDLRYRIINQQTYTDAYGDVNGDGTIDLSDVNRAQTLGNVVSGDGYARNLTDGLVPSSTQRAAIVAGTVTMEEIIRADVDGSGRVSTIDVSYIQQKITLGSSFPVGASVTRVVLTVEDLTDPLGTSVDMLSADSSFNAVPFSTLSYKIDFIPNWSEANLTITDLRRFVPKVFTAIETTDITATSKNGGENQQYFPSNIILDGNIIETDGGFHPLDMEVNNIVLELPDGYVRGEIDIFNNFIKNKMKFSDGTLVGSTALTNNQVRVTAAIQSFCKDQNEVDYASVDGYAAVEELVGVLYTQSTGLLRIRSGYLRNIDTRPELKTKVVLTVYLKKAGFQNTETLVTESEVDDLLVAISV